MACDGNLERQARFREANPPSKIKERRAAHIAPFVDEFLEFSAAADELVRYQRRPLRKALGCIVRQREALRRFLENGRVRVDSAVPAKSRQSPPLEIGCNGASRT